MLCVRYMSACATKLWSENRQTQTKVCLVFIPSSFIYKSETAINFTSRYFTQTSLDNFSEGYILNSLYSCNTNPLRWIKIRGAQITSLRYSDHQIKVLSFPEHHQHSIHVCSNFEQDFNKVCPTT